MHFVWLVSVYDGCLLQIVWVIICPFLFVLSFISLAEAGGDLVENCMIMWLLLSDFFWVMCLQVSAVNLVSTKLLKIETIARILKVRSKLLQPRCFLTNLCWTLLSGCRMFLLLNINSLALLSLDQAYQGHTNPCLSHSPSLAHTQTHIFTALLPAPPCILSSFLDGERGD